ncbi:LPXTG cell wall anchor domain-containing protein [Vagococcus sp. BWB3-3]|uniref:LPXTG cell wall anchor domain-containing protein n=1 Tax=Vagococcus allomyrinae TaxID=2794353 RepID=A0A940PFM6_9ENTE|nr:LPXTG cell wall anchor domain-containing protein [Vagococcus allomyrinae]MBP1042666.1 LPXTG cell wall anchor domain-containing protein [Vagococcus allomyrinae]
MKKGVYLATVGVLLATSFPTEILAAEQELSTENTVVEVEVSGKTEDVPALIEEVITEVTENAVIEENAGANQPEVAVVENEETPSVPSISPVIPLEEDVNQPVQRAAAVKETSVTTNDTPLIDHEKTITDKNAVITSEYNFMPNFNNLDQVIVTGDVFASGTNSSSSINKEDYYTFALYNAAKNSISITYKNVGLYDGKKIDLKVTVKDWSLLNSSDPTNQFVTIYANNSFFIKGLSNILFDYAFLDNQTANAVKVSGFFNFTDIDMNQSIDIFDNNNLKNIYTSDSNKLYYRNEDGYLTIGDPNFYFTTPDDEDFWVTYTYDQVSNFSIRFRQDRETQAYFSYEYSAPVVIEESEPPKKIVESKEPAPIFQSLSTKTKEEPVQTKVVQEKEVTLAATPNESSHDLPATGEHVTPSFTTYGTIIALLSLIFLKRERKN